MSVYNDVKIKLPNKIRIADIDLESSCDNLDLKRIKKIAKIIDSNGNFVFSTDKKHVLRQLNLYIHSHDLRELDFICYEANVNKKVLPLDRKWFLNISMSQSYAIIKACSPFFKIKKHLFDSFLEFYESRRKINSIQSIQDIERLEIMLNKFKDDVYLYKRNSAK